MIVQSHDAHLLLITQPDHARLARRLMERCPALLEQPRRDDILAAIEGHDAGWAEFDAAPTVDAASGEIADFIRVPLPTRHQWGPRSVELLAEHAPYAAGLVAHHAAFVYERFRGDPEWAVYLARMEALRDELCGGAFRQEDYAFLRLADLISLTFCTGWTTVQHHAGWRVWGDESSVMVEPAAWGAGPIEFSIAARRLPRQAFTSDQHLRSALADAEAVTLRGVLFA